MINNKILQSILALVVSIIITSPLLISIVNGSHLLVFTSIMLLFASINKKITHMYVTTRLLVFISTSILSALLTWMVESIRSIMWGATEPYFTYSFALSFIVGSSGYFIDQITARTIPVKKISICVSSVLLVIVLSCFFLKGSNLNYQFPIIDSPILFGVSTGFCIGSFLCLSLFEILLPSLNFFKYLSAYLRALVLPASAFFIWYIIIIIIFSGIFALSQAIFGHQFTSNNNVSIAFNDYLYYSFMSITTLGDGDITPIALLSRWITMLEVILGLFWMTIVLAATLGYVQEKFNKIAIQHKQEM